MTNPNIGNADELHPQDAKALLDLIEKLSDKVDAQEVSLTEAYNALANVGSRLASVEEQLAKVAPKPRVGAHNDELALQVLAFLAANPGIKFTGGIVAANLGIETAKRSRIYTRMEALHRTGKIERDGDGALGTNALYWVAPESS
jgi:hypothetical protein